MAKLFVKLLVLVLLTSLASFYIQRLVFGWTRENTPNPSTHERFRRQFLMIAEVLRQYPYELRQARFDQLKSLIGSTDVFLGPSRLLTLNELETSGELDDKALGRIKGRLHYSRDLPDGNGYDVYHLILDDETVLVMRSPYEKPRPLLVFGVFSFTQFTWIVESVLYAVVILFWVSLFRRDMLALESAAHQIGGGKFDIQIHISRGAALSPLAEAMNAMAAKVNALIRSHQQLTNAISHELRTPITRLRFRHELAIDAATAEAKDQELRQMDTAIDLLDELSTELLEYARMDREVPRLDVAPIDTDPWLDGLVQEAAEVAKSDGREVRVSARAELESVDGDYRYLSRAASNLLRNAVRYARSQVEVSLTREGTHTVLKVDDDGPGIPLAERERLFEPFSRLDSSRDRASGGFGIGLAIVRQIARWHGGKIEIGDSPLGGAQLKLSWTT
jgi:signal transduction histidine kinase